MDKNFGDKDLNAEIKRLLADWKSMISSYQVPSSKKATFQLLTTILPFIALWVAIYYVIQFSILWAIPLFCVNALFLFRIFVIQHDCGHHSFFSSKKMNRFIGTLCSVFSFIPFDYWSRIHGCIVKYSSAVPAPDSCFFANILRS